MNDPSPPTTQLQGLLERFAAGDPNAPDALIRRSCERLRQLTRQMLRLSNVKRLRPTMSCRADAAAAFAERGPPGDAARRFRAGHAGSAANCSTFPALLGPQGGERIMPRTVETARRPARSADSAAEPSMQAEWCEFHRIVETLL